MDKHPLIVLTTDFSDEAERAYAPVVEFAARIGGRIDLLHVVEELHVIPYGAAFAPPLELGVGDLVEVEAAARRLMDIAVRKLGSVANVEGHVIRGDRAATAICEHAERCGAAFLALSTHGRTGLRRMVMGSTAEQLMRHAVTPMLIYPRSG